MTFLKKHLWLILILLIASALRLYKLDFQSPWLDELHTLVETDLKLSFKEMWHLIIFREQIPHLHFLIVKFFSFIFGHNIIIARLVSVFFGVLSVLFIYKFGKYLISERLGLIAALLLSLNQFAIEYSQEARVYCMYMFFVILSFYYLAKLILQSNKKNAILLGVSIGLMLNSHLIGLLFLVIIGLIYFIYFLNNKENKLNLIKNGVIVIFITIVFALPILKTLFKSSEFSSFWISELSFGYFLQTMTHLLGYSSIVSYIYMLSGISLIAFLFKNYKKSSQKENLFLIIILSWTFMFLAVMVLKSTFGISIFLHRYLIGLLPAFVLAFSYVTYKIKNKIILISIVIVLCLLNIYTLFVENDYYKKVRKSQYNLVASEVLNSENKSNIIVSKWGYTYGYYFKDEYVKKEIDLNNYVNELRNGKISPQSFWYLDGNSNVFDLTNENQKFINENFNIKNKIEKFDAWGMFFENKNTSNGIIYFDLNNFKNGLFDGQGQMVITSNFKYSYPEFSIENGKYVLKLHIQSLPDPPLNNINTNFNLYINNQKLTNFYASEKEDQLINTFEIEIKNGKLLLELEYTNDEVINNIDRNAILKNIELKKN